MSEGIVTALVLCFVCFLIGVCVGYQFKKGE
jgi:hypothetical protein